MTREERREHKRLRQRAWRKKNPHYSRDLMRRRREGKEWLGVKGRTILGVYVHVNLVGKFAGRRKEL